MPFRIETQPALIGIQTTNAKLEIQQPKADVNMHTEKPKLEIHTEPIQVQIDQYPCRAEAGLKNYKDLTKDNVEFARQKMGETIDKIVRQGNELMDIHENEDTIANQAEENAYLIFKKEWNIGFIPTSRPIIDFKGGNVDIQVKEGKVNMDVKVNKPIVDYTAGKVDIYLRQKNSIHIEYMREKFNQLG
ncbi:DUF6470 family protein [Inediibacterium massiliense]|uniref:DUF6470 family protein n=1 Tax=Inediibacterium massiliense TaxID=1658111 RepID=UPI0006B4C9B8|nr:DUF6470 family protein [Inediibacterium massiliense]